MGLLGVILATVAGFGVGAAYYMALAKPWMKHADIKVGEDGNPVNAGSMPYIVSLIMILLVAGMMRHTFALSGIDTVSKGLISGFGVGAFFISPWIFINTGYSNRPWMLAVIDSGYAILASMVIGVVLTVM